MQLTRRAVLGYGGLGAVGLVAGVARPSGPTLEAKSASFLSDRNMPKPYQRPFVEPPVLAPKYTTVADDGAPVEHYEVTEKLVTASLLPNGLSTPLLAYNGIFPGPTIAVEQGTRTTLKVRNHLPAVHPSHGYPLATSTHLHGSASKPQFDGYADDVTHPGYFKKYEYPNFQSARSIWYHDHGVHHTAVNAYSGLAANYVIHDPVERALLPQGRFDVHLTVSDAMFNADGSLAYDDNSHSGLWGDVILVNGVPWPVMKVQRRIYRFRVLNCSIARSYRFRLSTGDPVTMVATDGGLMPVARRLTSWRHAGSERYEVLVDFSRYQAGTRVQLLNSSNENNVDYDHTGKIMAFDVVDEPVDTSDPTALTLPTTLASSAVMDLRPNQSVKSRYMRLRRDDGVWTINGKSWKDVEESGYTWTFADPELDDVEIWEVENKSGGWFHPLHIHLVDFQVLSRNGRAPFDWERGPKDVVYVGEGESVKLLMRFEHQRGRYMVHCHNLPHEDHDMMVQFAVGLDDVEHDPNDPILAAPCEPDYDPA